MLLGFVLGLALLVVGVGLLVLLARRREPAPPMPRVRVLRPSVPDETAVFYVVAPTDPLYGDPTELVETYYERCGR